VALVLPDTFNAQGMNEVWHHPQFAGAFRLTLFTGLASTTLALFFSLLIVARSNQSFSARAGGFLAVPHLAFAIGLAFLIMPAGMLARIAAQFAGWAAPPAWITTQDPYGFALTFALVLKETPFLVWALASVLNRDDLRQAFAGQRAVAASLGHPRRSVFLQVILPQLLPRVIWPLIAVLAYGMTVVDMALVIGPTQPPTLAQLIWVDINDADPAVNGRGAAGVVVLSGVILLVVATVAALLRSASTAISGFLSKGPHPPRMRPAPSPRRRDETGGSIASPWRSWHGVAVTDAVPLLWKALLVIYVLVIATLILQSVSGLWPFPNLLAEHFTLSAWRRLLTDASPVFTSLALAILTATTSLAASVLWLESVPQSKDKGLLWLSAFALCLPALVIGLGQYRLFLALGISGTATAMFFAHILPVAAYVFIMLQGPYRGFDDRFRSAASGLRASRAHFLRQVKWPMLKAALLSAFAVGFAVSMAQYVPAQLAAAGRFSTLPMEAVTLTSGGNRALTAAYGLALMALPLIVFVVAGRLGRSRWKTV
jgi:putative thiamine transport system permease protein